MDKMRELVQQSASSSTELSAAAEQMLKLSRNLLDSMDRFVLEQQAPQLGGPRRDSAEGRRKKVSHRERERAYAGAREEVNGTQSWMRPSKPSAFAPETRHSTSAARRCARSSACRRSRRATVHRQRLS